MTTFRELLPEELDALPDAFYVETDHLNTGVRYNRDCAMSVVAAEDAQGIAGLWIVKPTLHCGPLWVREDRRAPSMFVRAGMWEKVREIIAGNGGSALMIAMDKQPKVAQIIRGLGGERVPGSLFLVRS